MLEEQSPGIIMLCNFYEDGLQKCDEFWPLDNSAFKYYGKMFINNKKVEHQDQYNIYTLEVLPDGCSNSLITRLAHCTVWPDKGVPPSGRMVLRLLKWMQTLEVGGLFFSVLPIIVFQKPGIAFQTGPVTVLCSAGVGRSGTLIAIESVCTKLFKGQEAKVC
uniref:Tyrosine-protein phosphatase domain-containing protein n=1 Tax=Heterorhabditis bacteriophora TaxID=37862 RepID=A0A1I7WZN0_HETBA